MTDETKHDPFDRIEAAASRYESESAAEPEGGGEHLPARADEGPGTAEVLEQLLGPTFQIIAPAWEVQRSEVKALSEAYAGVLDKWFPEGSSYLGPEVAAAMVTLGVFGPRIGKPRHYEKPEPDEGAKPGDTGKAKPAEENLSPVQQQTMAMDDPTAGEKVE